MSNPQCRAIDRTAGTAGVTAVRAATSLDEATSKRKTGVEGWDEPALTGCDDLSGVHARHQREISWKRRHEVISNHVLIGQVRG